MKSKIPDRRALLRKMPYSAILRTGSWMPDFNSSGNPANASPDTTHFVALARSY
jgi:hypothetical protein